MINTNPNIHLMRCCICKRIVNEYGRNPYPVRKRGMCCSSCDEKYVQVARLGIAVKVPHRIEDR